jgi:hypothetical protein
MVRSRASARRAKAAEGTRFLQRALVASDAREPLTRKPPPSQQVVTVVTRFLRNASQAASCEASKKVAAAAAEARGAANLMISRYGSE